MVVLRLPPLPLPLVTLLPLLLLLVVVKASVVVPREVDRDRGVRGVL